MSRYSLSQLVEGNRVTNLKTARNICDDGIQVDPQIPFCVWSKYEAECSFNGAIAFQIQMNIFDGLP